jgi:hypothetical protein
MRARLHGRSILGCMARHRAINRVVVVMGARYSGRRWPGQASDKAGSGRENGGVARAL